MHWKLGGCVCVVLIPPPPPPFMCYMGSRRSCHSSRKCRVGEKICILFLIGSQCYLFVLSILGLVGVRTIAGMTSKLESGKCTMYEYLQFFIIKLFLREMGGLEIWTINYIFIIYEYIIYCNIYNLFIIYKNKNVFIGWKKSYCLI